MDGWITQVHERQTARMRTRSEWFLGPKDGDVLCMAPNTCSNCYLTVHGGGVNEMTASGNYLGGGSTRDMRRVDMDHHQSAGPSSSTDHAEAINTSLFLFYKQQQQQRHYHQHQLLAGQRQSFHLSPDFMMDTDDGYTYGGSGTHTSTTQTTTHSSMQQQQGSHLMGAARTTGQQQHNQLNPHALTVTGGLYLDTNYGIYDFDDTDILISTTRTFTTTTTTTTTTTSTTSSKENNFLYNNNNNFKCNTNNINKHYKHNLETNNNNYTRQHFNDQDETFRSPPYQPTMVSSLSYTKPQPQQQQHNHRNHMHVSSTSTSFPTHNQQQGHSSQYYSTESLLSNHKYLDANADHEDEEPPCCSTSTLASKLSYHSLRQQQFDFERKQQKRSNDVDDKEDKFSLNSSNANITSIDNTTTTTTTDPFPCSHPDEVDFMLTSSSGSQYRHSTPLMQQRRRLRQQGMRRQRLPSNSSSLYQSFNASLQSPTTSTGVSDAVRANHFIASGHNSRNSLYESQNETRSVSSSGGGGVGVGGRSGSSNSNIVSIVFNVLDFLF